MPPRRLKQATPGSRGRARAHWRKKGRKEGLGKKPQTRPSARGYRGARSPRRTGRGSSRSYAIEVLARAKQAPRPRRQHGEQHRERRYVGEQWVDVMNEQHF